MTNNLFILPSEGAPNRKEWKELEDAIINSGLLAMVNNQEYLEKINQLHEDKFVGAVSEAVDLLMEIIYCYKLDRQIAILSRLHRLYKMNPVGGKGNNYLAYIFKIACQNRGKYKYIGNSDVPVCDKKIIFVQDKKKEENVGCSTVRKFTWSFPDKKELVKQISGRNDLLLPEELVELNILPTIARVYGVKGKEWGPNRYYTASGRLFFKKVALIDWVNTHFDGKPYREFIASLKKDAK